MSNNFNTTIAHNIAPDSSLLCADAIRQLMDSTTPPKQKAITTVLVEHYSNPALSKSKRDIINKIFQHIIDETHEDTRAFLANAVCDCRYLSHELAFQMACDIEQVAVPMLAFSEVLEEDDLLEVITHFPDIFRQKAIAGRKSVSAEVSEGLIDQLHEGVIAKLLSNPNVSFSGRGIRQLVNHFAENMTITGLMIEHKAIPVTVTEALMARSAEHIKAHLKKKYDHAKYEIAARVIDENHALQIIMKIGTDAPYNNIKDIVHHMKRQDRLNPAFVLTALFSGRIKVFEAALAVLTNMQLQNLRYELYESQDKVAGLHNVLKQTHLSESLFPIIELGLTTFLNVSSKMPEVDNLSLLEAVRLSLMDSLKGKHIQHSHFALKTTHEAIRYML